MPVIVVLEKLRQSWRRFKAGVPGRRFQQQFSRREQSRRSLLKKALFLGGGIFLMATGIFFLFVPGPGIFILVLGALLVAKQSLLAARILDWTEIRLRKLLDWSLRAWRRSSPVLKILLVVLALVIVGAVGLSAFKLLVANHDLRAVAWLGADANSSGIRIR